MKDSFLFILTVLLACCMTTVVYARNNNSGKGDSAVISYDSIYEAGISIILPKVALKNDSVANAINHTLSVENLTGYSVEELITINRQIETQKNADTIITDDDGLDNIEPYIRKNNDGVLSIEIDIWYLAAIISATYGAHPMRPTFLNFDLATGQIITIDSLVKKEKISQLLRLCHEQISKNYTLARKKYGKEYPLAFLDGPETDYNAFGEENLQQFYIGSNGLYFYYKFSFMHCDEDIAPDPIIYIPKEKLKQLLVRHVYGL